MKKILQLVLILVFFITSLPAQDDISRAKWQSTKVVTDGNNNEWQKPFNFYDDATGLMFSLANDHDNLYMCFTGKDERKINKLMKAGWIIELSSKEKKKKFDISLSFPAEETNNNPDKTGKMENTERPSFKNMVAGYKLNLQSVSTKGFTTNNGDMPLLNKNGINIGVGEDSTQEIVFEIAIPLKELLPENIFQLNEEMNLGVVVNALPKPSTAHPMHVSGNGQGTGGGGHMGGGGGHMGGGGGGRHAGGGGGGNSADSFDRNSFFEKAGFKQKFRLTTISG